MWCITPFSVVACAEQPALIEYRQIILNVISSSWRPQRCGSTCICIWATNVAICWAHVGLQLMLDDRDKCIQDVNINWMELRFDYERQCNCDLFPRIQSSVATHSFFFHLWLLLSNWCRSFANEIENCHRNIESCWHLTIATWSCLRLDLTTSHDPNAKMQRARAAVRVSHYQWCVALLLIGVEVRSPHPFAVVKWMRCHTHCRCWNNKMWSISVYENVTDLSAATARIYRRHQRHWRLDSVGADDFWHVPQYGRNAQLFLRKHTACACASVSMYRLV